MQFVSIAAGFSYRQGAVVASEQLLLRTVRYIDIGER